MAVETEADTVGYGGAAGGGKTDFLCGLSLTRHTKSIIFRRELAQTTDIAERIKAIAPVGRFNGQKHMFYFPGGKTIELGGAAQDGKLDKYRGRPHDHKAFDELTSFLRSMFEFLTTWLRTTIPDQRTRITATFNPPENDDGLWVIEYFAPWLDETHHAPANPGELRWYAYIDGKETAVDGGKPFSYKGERIVPKSRTFIPARLTDNPFLKDSSYLATLQAKPEPLRSQLLFGDFKAARRDGAYQVIPADWVKAAFERWREGSRPAIPVSAVGGDIARGGDDESVFYARRGNWFDEPVVVPGVQTADGPSTVPHILRALDGAKAPVNLDSGGIGAGAVDAARLAGLQVNAINFAESAGREQSKSGDMRFRNMRALMYWRLRESLDPLIGDGLALPPSPELLADLTSARWQLSSAGIQIESKDEIRKRLHRSPDRGDALILANFNCTLNILGYYRTEAEKIRVADEEVIPFLRPRNRDLDPPRRG